jgi:hypothetical protein
MNLANVNNEVVAIDDENVMVADDEELFCVSSNSCDAGANSSTIR